MAANKNGLRPLFIKKLNACEVALKKAGIKVIMTQGYRSIEAQNALYAKGRTAPGSKVTNAKGGSSWHNFGLAADYVFVINGKVTYNGPWAKFGKIAESCGLEWGGNFKSICDRPHVQNTGGKTLKQMLKGDRYGYV